MTLPPYTPEEWEQKRASLLEDVRILRAGAADLQANADMLRARGHEELALVMEAEIFTSTAVADKIEATLEEAPQ